MRAWVDYIAGLAGVDRLWTGGFQLGDWLDPTAPHDAPFEAQADPDVVATAYLARSAEVVGLAAAVAGDADVAEKYARLAGEVRDAFAREFVTPGGRVLNGLRERKRDQGVRHRPSVELALRKRLHNTAATSRQKSAPADE